MYQTSLIYELKKGRYLDTETHSIYQVYFESGKTNVTKLPKTCTKTYSSDIEVIISQPHIWLKEKRNLIIESKMQE
jgi:hypothetical protein